jgi:hypothetical protein
MEIAASKKSDTIEGSESAEDSQQTDNQDNQKDSADTNEQVDDTATADENLGEE